VNAPLSARRAAWLTAAVTLLFLAGLVAFVAVDRRPPTRDEAESYLRSIDLADRLTHADDGAADLLSDLVRGGEPAFPPGLRVLHLPFLLATGNAGWAFLVLHVLLVVGLVVAVHETARRTAGPPAAPLAVFYLATMPTLLYLAARPTSAFPLATLSAVCAFLAVLSDRLTRRGPAVALGVVTGLGILITPGFPVYLAGPLAWAVLVPRRPSDTAPRGPVALPLALAGAAVLVLPWYMLHDGRIVDSLTDSIHHVSYDVLSYNYFIYIVNNLITSDAHGVLFPAAAVGAALMARTRERGGMWLPIFWLAAPVAWFTLAPWKGPDVLVPALPALALAAAWGYSRLHTEKAKALWVGASIVVQVAGIWNVYGADRLPVSGLNRWLGTAASERMAPLGTDWGIGGIGTGIARTADRPAYRPLRIAVLPELPYLNPATVAVAVATGGIRAVPVDLEGLSETEARAALQSADFIVQKDGFQGRDDLAESNARIREFLKRPDQSSRLRFVDTLPLPDGSLAWVVFRPGIP
jgi:hypothetical protein